MLSDNGLAEASTGAELITGAAAVGDCAKLTLLTTDNATTSEIGFLIKLYWLKGYVVINAHVTYSV